MLEVICEPWKWGMEAGEVVSPTKVWVKLQHCSYSIRNFRRDQ